MVPSRSRVRGARQGEVKPVFRFLACPVLACIWWSYRSRRRGEAMQVGVMSCWCLTRLGGRHRVVSEEVLEWPGADWAPARGKC